MKKVLIFLQNAYGVADDYIPGYQHPSFAKSRTGRRLTEMLPENKEIGIANASLKIGNTPDSYFPPDELHMQECINAYKPDVILACGKAAKNGISKLNLNIPIVYSPHPAYRALSKKITQEIKLELESI
jgi:hypothetical protein